MGEIQEPPETGSPWTSLYRDLPGLKDRRELEDVIAVSANLTDWQLGDLKVLITGYDLGSKEFREGVNAALLWVTGYTLPHLVKRRV